MSLTLGCTDYMKMELGNDFRRGNVYGALFYNPDNIGDKLFDIWTPGIWHSFCTTASKSGGFLNFYIDGRQELEIGNYTGFLMNSGSNIVVLSDVLGKLDVKTDITDVNIWKGVKEENFMKKWSLCQSDEEGDYLKWSTSEMKLTNVKVIVDYEMLKCKSENKLIVSQYLLDLEETLDFCKKVGGKVAVAKDRTSLQEMINVVKNFPECQEQFFAGYSDRDQEGNWTDINTGESMTWEYWAPEEPDNFAKMDQDCAVYDPLKDKIKDKLCKIPFCPICDVELPKKFQMNGPHNKFDTHFVMKNLSYFQGYMFNNIVKMDDSWDSIFKDNDTIIGSWKMTNFEKYPIGLKHWMSSSNSKHKAGMSFTIFVKQPGNYFCPGGEIIGSDLVCNGVSDCSSGDEENICRKDLIQPSRSKSPHSQSLDSIDIKTFVSILKILDISQEESTFTIYFWLRLRWFNPSVEFYFLKNNYKLNDKYATMLVEPEVEGTNLLSVPVIMPNLTFLHLDNNPLTTFEEIVYVGRREKPIMHDDYFRMDTSKSSGERFKGSENPYIKDSLNQGEFTCSFDNMKNYPFGLQNCSFEFLLIKTTAKLEAGEITYQGSNEVGQYIIDKWFLSCGKAEEIKIEGCPDCKPISPCKVTVQMSRNLLSVIIITFAPPFLLNVLNQASVYLKGDSMYDLIITVNITIMMVLASIYVSVSGSLHSTPSVKPVELYLVFNLLYPFLVIVVTVARQVN